MTVVHMDVPPRFGAMRPSLFRKSTRDALADVIAQRFPFGRRGAVRKEFKLTDDQARGVCRGDCAWQTFDQVLDEGGWALALELLAIRFGEGLDQHLERERRRHAALAEDLGEVVRDFRSVAAGGAGRGARVVAAEPRHMGAGHPPKARAARLTRGDVALGIEGDE